WTLEKLKKNKVKKTILAVNYMADAFIKRYGKKAYGMKIFYSRDPYPAPETLPLFQRPLRTGGPIKRAEKLIGHKKPFLVLNGDILTNINYAEFMKKHEASDAIATIALHEVEDPSRYGVVELTSEGRIVRFVEKPTREEAPSNLVNAGIYALNPEIFDYIPEGPVSIEHEIFPKLAKEGRLHGYNFQGYWTDIGEPNDYLKANQLLLDLEIKKERLSKNTVLESEAEIHKPCIIGENVTIGSKSKIGPYAAIGENVIVGKGVLVENSIIFPRTIISDFTSIKGAIIGEASMIGRWVKIENGCIVGDHAMIQDNVTLTQGVSVCPSKEVTESVLTPKCLM
ncbi:MAG: sugar phosphate nucleotidyltransferase, partial [Candidatus Bathyarchaeia archaeon]